MALPRLSDLTPPREPIAVIVSNKNGQDDEEIRVVATRELYRFLSEIHRLIIQPGNPLSKAEDESVEINSKIQDNVSSIQSNENAINTNNTSISQINADLVVITGDISTLASSLSALSTSFTGHSASNTEHGVTGDNVGTGDFATPTVGGVVKEAADPGDPTGTFTTLAAVEAWAVTLRTNLQNAGIMA